MIFGKGQSNIQLVLGEGCTGNQKIISYRNDEDILHSSQQSNSEYLDDALGGSKVVGMTGHNDDDNMNAHFTSDGDEPEQDLENS